MPRWNLAALLVLTSASPAAAQEMRDFTTSRQLHGESRLDTRLTRLRLRLGHQGGVDLDSHATRAELLRRGDRDASVSGSEIVDEVLRADISQLQHCAHDRHRRWLVANVLPRSRATTERRERSQDEAQQDLFHPCVRLPKT